MKKWPRVVDTGGHAEARFRVVSQNPSVVRTVAVASRGATSVSRRQYGRLMASKHDEVLRLVRSHGWQYEVQPTPDGTLFCNVCTSPVGRLLIAGVRRLWTPEGRYAGAIFSDLKTRKDRNLWRFRGKDSVLDLLASVMSPS